MANSWKYAKYLNQFHDCPPGKVKCESMLAYRWVHADKDHPNNFRPVALIPGADKIPDRKACCTGYSLSFYTNREQAAKKLEWAADARPELISRVGNCIAWVAIDSSDGECGPASKTYHFDMFEYADADLVKRIENIEKIVELEA